MLHVLRYGIGIDCYQTALMTNGDHYTGFRRCRIAETEDRQDHKNRCYRGKFYLIHIRHPSSFSSLLESSKQLSIHLQTRTGAVIPGKANFR